MRHAEDDRNGCQLGLCSSRHGTLLNGSCRGGPKKTKAIIHLTMVFHLSHAYRYIGQFSTLSPVDRYAYRSDDESRRREMGDSPFECDNVDHKSTTPVVTRDHSVNLAMASQHFGFAEANRNACQPVQTNAKAPGDAGASITAHTCTSVLQSHPSSASQW